MVPAALPRLRLNVALPAAAGLVALLSAGINLWYFSADATPPSYDEAWYLEIACRLYHALSDQGPWAFYREYAAAFKFKAPLISVLPLPFFLFSGLSMDSALLVNIAALLLLAFYLFRLGRLLFGETTAALSVLIAMTFPLLYALSRRYFVEFALSAVVTATVYHLIASQELRRENHNRALGVLLGAGILLKSLYPLYLLGPLTDFFLRKHRELGGNFRRKMGRPLRTILVIAVPIALTWYAHNALYTAGFMLRAAFGDIAAHYGSTRVFTPGVLLNYWLDFVNGTVSPYYALAAFSVGAALWLRLPSGKRLHRLRRHWRENSGLRLTTLWFFVPFAITTLSVNKDPRFLAPALPALALLLAAGLDRLTQGRRWRLAALAAFFIMPLNLYALQTFGAAPIPEFRLGPFKVLATRSGYGTPPDPTPRPRQQWLVDRIAEEISYRPAVVMSGIESPHFNANTLSYFSARRNHPLKFVNYGYAETRIERTVARMREKEADFLLLIDGVPPDRVPPEVRKLDAQIRELIRQNRLPFKRIAKFDPGSGIKTVLYRRTAPIRMFGAPSRP